MKKETVQKSHEMYKKKIEEKKLLDDPLLMIVENNFQISRSP